MSLRETRKVLFLLTPIPVLRKVPITWHSVCSEVTPETKCLSDEFWFEYLVHLQPQPHFHLPDYFIIPIVPKYHFIWGRRDCISGRAFAFTKTIEVGSPIPHVVP